MELKMKAICDGRKTRREVTQETIEQYRAVYMRTQQRLDVLKEVRVTSKLTSARNADYCAGCAEVRRQSSVMRRSVAMR